MDNLKLIEATSQNQPEFFGLNDDCIRPILDCLSIEELSLMKMTCKRIYSLANESFCNTYKNETVVFSVNRRKFTPKVFKEHLQSFKFLMPRIHCSYVGKKTFQTMGKKMHKNVKFISFWGHIDALKMCDEYCVYAKDILAFVDTIELKRCASIKCLLKYCTKLEYLILDDIQPKELISQKYPAIKQLRWTSDNLPPQLKEFMVNNPNITAFFASNQNPIETTDWLLETGRFKVKLNDLVLKICNFKNAEYLNALQMNVPGIIKNVMSLHKNQQIKTLHLEIKYLDFLLHPKLPEIEFLESAHVYIEDAHRKSIESISRGMRNLKFLFYYNKYRAKKSEYQMLAQNLTELEEFHTISVGSIDVVMPFIRYSPKLRVMFLETSELYPTAKNVSLELLHKERHKLENACKLTIYVDEPTYLNSPINSCGLVEIKRTASYPLSKHPIRPLKS